nr:MAG TPA_asm: hypothetical protein [Caudoviricetes sp.]
MRALPFFFGFFCFASGFFLLRQQCFLIGLKPGNFFLNQHLNFFSGEHFRRVTATSFIFYPSFFLERIT